jgi:hypothetical protein
MLIKLPINVKICSREKTESRIHEHGGKGGKRTKRGRTSTMSSGTRKINAFIFLAIEIANLAVSFRQPTIARDNATTPPTVLSPIFILPALVHVDDERRIDDPRSKRLEEVEDEDAGRDRGVFERPDRARARFRFLDGRVRPFEHLLVGDGFSGPGETRERLGDVQPINTRRGQHRRGNTGERRTA